MDIKMLSINALLEGSLSRTSQHFSLTSWGVQILRLNYWIPIEIDNNLLRARCVSEILDQWLNIGGCHFDTV